MEREDQKRSASAIRSVVALGFVSLFTDVSSEMCFGLLPTFILTLSGANRAILGVIEGVAEALSYGLRSISGIFSDRVRKRKRMVFLGYSVSTAVKPMFSAAQTATDAFAIRVADRVGKAIRTSPRDALLSETVPEKRMGTAFGLHRTLDQLGAIVGPVVASALILLGFVARDIFLLSVIPAAVALAILVVFVQERVRPPTKAAPFLSGMSAVLNRRFVFLLLVVGVFSIGAFDFSFVLIRAQAAGLPEAMIPLIYAVINVAHTAIAVPAGVMSDRIGGEKALAAGYLAFLVSTLLLSFPSGGLFYAFLIAAVYGTYVGIVETVQRALIPVYAPGTLRGTAYGMYYLVVGVCFFW